MPQMQVSQQEQANNVATLAWTLVKQQEKSDSVRAEAICRLEGKWFFWHAVTSAKGLPR